MTQVSVLITGCTVGGLGLETAKQLAAQQNCLLYLTCKDKEKLQASREELKASLQRTGNTFGSSIADLDLLVDLASLNSVRQLATRFVESGRELDVLINNAGVMFIPEETRTVDGFEMHYQVNFLGHFLLTQLLTPVLLETSKKNGGRPSRVINISSDAHGWVATQNLKSSPYLSLSSQSGGSEEYSANLCYGMSKLLQIFHSTEILRRYYIGKGPKEPKIFACSLHPGVVATQISRNASQEVKDMLVDAQTSSKPGFKVKTVADGAETGVFCATMSLESLDRVLLASNLKEDEIFLYFDNSTQKKIGQRFRSIDLVEKAWMNAEKAIGNSMRSKL